MRPIPNEPYNDLPALPPTTDIATPSVLQKCITASRELSRLDQAWRELPDPSVLINTIPLFESQSSSEIENIVTTRDALFRADSIADATNGIKESLPPEVKETLRYRTALRNGFDLLEEDGLTFNLAQKICSTIKHETMQIRDCPVYIGSRYHVVYTPPDDRRVIKKLIANWVTFSNNDSVVDPLISMAVSHAQFEAIHPFTDGNGRTGRILNLLHLKRHGLLQLPVLYLSGYILDTRTDYYRLLSKINAEHAWEEWILYMLDAVEATSQSTLRLIRAITELQKDVREYIRSKLNLSRLDTLMETLFRQPYCRISNLMRYGIKTRVTAASYLRQLANIGILEEHKSGRDVLFVHRAYLDLLNRPHH